MSTVIKVASFIVSKTGVTLYTIDGKVHELKSSDYRTANLIEKITPIVARRQIAEVDLTDFDSVRAVEAKSNGLIRFFRVAKEKVKSIFGLSAEREIGAGYNGGMVRAPVEEEAAPQPGVSDITADQVAELEKANTDTDAGTTLVAVVGDTPIIGADALQSQIDHAAVNQEQAVGFVRFMERLATVVKERKHTAQELMDFMRLADLPIADDGSIIGYKTLDKKDGMFVDCHSKRVTQQVGSVVEMNVEMVDDNRRVQCSNGLHIARRKYLNGYFGDALMLVKIAPEDVVSVPMGEPDKMRVARYHIVAELPKSVHGFIKSNKPMTGNEEAATILGNVIKGNHAEKIEIVHIGGQKGNNLKITPLVNGEAAPVELDDTVKAKVLDDQQAAPHLAPAAINEQVETILKEERAKAEPTPAPAPAKTYAPKKAKAPKKPKAEKPAPVKSVTIKMDDNQKKAVKLVQSGMSKREAERKTGVSARTIGRLIEKINAA